MTNVGIKMKLEIELIDVNDRLPDFDVWVLVLEDDSDNSQDYFFAQVLKLEPRYRLTPAKLRGLGLGGEPEWYLCYVGGSPVNHVRNVTHWVQIPTLPPKVLPEDYPNVKDEDSDVIQLPVSFSHYIGESVFFGSPYDDTCPDCSGKVVSRCKCAIGSAICENGHEWYRERGTGRAIPGNGHN